MPITRKQVAQRAGVSEATVSHVVNNGPRFVSPDTKVRVERAIEELGYHPSHVARSLRMQRTSTIGLVVPDTANPFYGEIARTFEDTCYTRGYTVILCNSHFDETRELDYVDLLRAKRVDGIAFIPVGADSQAISRLAEIGICTVVLDYEITQFYCITIDDSKGGQLATQYLIDLGHQRIACIADTRQMPFNRTRLDGYKLVLQEAGLPMDESLIVRIEPNVANGETAALALLDHSRPPTAIFANDDMVALGVLSAIHKCGLRVPEDISVIGFDDNFAAAYFTPPLTTVAYPKQMMGKEGANLLINLLQQTINNDLPVPDCSYLDVELVERSSTAPPRE